MAASGFVISSSKRNQLRNLILRIQTFDNRNSFLDNREEKNTSSEVVVII